VTKWLIFPNPVTFVILLVTIMTMLHFRQFAIPNYKASSWVGYYVTLKNIPKQLVAYSSVFMEITKADAIQKRGF